MCALLGGSVLYADDEDGGNRADTCQGKSTCVDER